MTQKMPRLSTDLTGPRDLEHCQSCGRIRGEVVPAAWQEHDEDDRPEPIVVMLCKVCADRIIGPHPRLYRRLAEHEPFPGAMPCCIGCRHSVSTACLNPSQRRMGGPGLVLKFPTPGEAIACSRGPGGGCRHVVIYTGPVTCDGREVPSDASAVPNQQVNDPTR